MMRSGGPGRQQWAHRWRCEVCNVINLTDINPDFGRILCGTDISMRSCFLLYRLRRLAVVASGRRLQ
jgi:hypothetical protein